MGKETIPHNEEAERGVLGSILLDPECLDEVVGWLSPDAFRDETMRVIYETIILVSNSRRLCDPLIVADELERAGHVCPHAIHEWCPYLYDLAAEVPTSGKIIDYARIVQRAYECRRLVHAAGQIAAMAYHQDDQVLDKAEQLLFSIRQSNAQSSFTSMSVLMNEYMQELDYLYQHKGQFTGVPTGYDDLDTCLGGLQKSDLILLAARPSMGKTSLGMCIGYNAALRGKRVAVFSLEMGKKLLARRLMSMQSKIDMQRLRGGWIEDDEWEKIERAYSSLSPLPIFINDTAGNPVASMRSQLRRLVQQNGGIDMVIVDYIGLIEPDADASKRENLVQQVSAISRGLKTLAREFDVPVLALCQLSRAVESRQNKHPQLSDLRDSGSLEQDCDVCLFIYREDYYAKTEARENYIPTHIAEVIIAKHRNGPTGNISLYFQDDQTMFYPLTVETPGGNA
jgi:replicative DNA helicase